MPDTNLRRPRPSGRFVLRIPPELHARLREEARDAGRSLNEICTRKLAAPGGVAESPGASIVARAIEQFGRTLVGVLLFGSWARGEAGTASDVDLLVVIDPEVPIVRSLYRPWDETPCRWEGRRLEVHFIHRPEGGARPTGLWAEVALDGLVLFDRDLELSRHLIQVRREIATGSVRREQSHGQPYWVEGR